MYNSSLKRSYMRTNPQQVPKKISRYNGKKSALLAVLQDIQEKYQWLPPDASKIVAEALDVSMINIHSFATFCRAFSLTPRGKRITTVCLGTASHVPGAPAVLDRIRDELKAEPRCTTADGNLTLESVNCLGACALAPRIVVDGKYYRRTNVQKADNTIDQYQKDKPKKKGIRRRKK